MSSSTVLVSFVAPIQLRLSTSWLPLFRQFRQSDRGLVARKRCFATKTTAQFSSPFPQPDQFAFPTTAFPVSSGPDIRPEILGALLWSFGLYFGFSQRSRWAESVRLYLMTSLTAISLPGAEIVADAVHWLPFFAAGMFVDAALRYGAGGNAIWAIATGTSVALYAGVYELGRQNLASGRLSDDEIDRYRTFQDVARRTLVPKGRCHFVDVRSAVRRDPASGPLRGVSDEMLRRFVRNEFPAAKRSRNGFYRGLSVRNRNDFDTSTPS